MKRDPFDALFTAFAVVALALFTWWVLAQLIPLYWLQYTLMVK